MNDEISQTLRTPHPLNSMLNVSTVTADLPLLSATPFKLQTHVLPTTSASEVLTVGFSVLSN